MHQLHFTIEPDAFLTLGYNTWWMYQYYTLTDNGFIENHHSHTVFTHCVFCNKYHWHIPMNRPDMSNSVYVCDTCRNHVTKDRIRLFN